MECLLISDPCMSRSLQCPFPRRGARDGEEGRGEGKRHTTGVVITSSGNILPEARHMYSPTVTCFYCEGYHMKQLNVHQMRLMAGACPLPPLLRNTYTTTCNIARTSYNVHVLSNK